MEMPSPAEPEPPAEVRLRDLRAGDVPVSIVARVVTAERREIVRKSDGGRRPVLSGLLSDGTASVRFTWWDPPSEPIERGDVIRAVNALVREFRGKPELSFNWKSRVAPAGEAELPSVRPEELPGRNVATLAEGDEGFRIPVRVVQVAPKSVSVGAERRLVHEGLVADAHGAVAFTAWSDFGLKPGEAIEVVGAYVRGFRGRPQLVLDDRSTVRRIPGTDLPSADVAGRPRALRVAEVESRRGGELLEVRGVVVGLSPPSGVVHRCPECRRGVHQGICRVHGNVAAEPDLRARLVLDDGTGALTVNLERDETERLWGRTLAECLEELRRNPDPEALTERLFEAVFGRRLTVRGRGASDDFGVTIFPTSIEAESPGSSVRATLAGSGGPR